MPPEYQIIAEYGPWGALIVAAMVYHKDIRAALSRVTRDPLIDTVMAGMAAQTAQFADNNKLFHRVVDLLTQIEAHGKDSAEQSKAMAAAVTELRIEIARQGGKS